MAHSVAATKAKCKAAQKCLPPVNTSQSMLSELEHYNRTLYNNNQGDPGHRIDAATSYLAGQYLHISPGRQLGTRSTSWPYILNFYWIPTCML